MGEWPTTTRHAILSRLSMLLPAGIRARLVLVLLVVLLPMIGLQAWIYYDRYKVRRAQEFKTQIEVARAVAKNFDLYLRDIVRQETAIGRALASKRFTGDEASRYLADQAAQYHSIRTLSWVSPKGVVIASSDPSLIGTDISDRPYFEDLASGRPWLLTDLHETGRLSGEVFFVIGRSLQDKAGRLLGAVVAGIDPRRLIGSTFNLTRPDQGAYAIFDAEGKVVFRSPERYMDWAERISWKANDDPLERVLRTGGEHLGITRNLFGTDDEWLSARVPIGRTGWVAGAGRAVDVAMAPVFRGLVRDSILLALVVGVGSLAALGVAYSTAGPIHLLRRQARAIGTENIVIDEDPLAPAEVREVQRAIRESSARLIESSRELRTQQELFRSIFEHAPAGIAIIDAETLRAEWTNSAYKRFLDEPYSSMDLNGMPLERFIPNFEKSGLAAIFREVRNTGKPYWNPEFRHQGFSRGTTYWRWSVLRLPPIIHRRSSLMILAGEVTDQVYARQAVERERALLRTILGALPVGVFIIDKQGRIVETNGTVEKVWRGKVPRAQAIPEYSLYKGWWPETGEPIKAHEWAAARAIEKGEISLGEVLVIERLDGTRATILNSAVPLRDGEGAIAGAVTVVQDITEQKAAVDAIQQSEAKFRRMFDANIVGIIFTDTDGRIQEANDYYLNLLGYSREEFEAGKISAEQLTPPEYVSRDRRAVELLRQTGVSQSYEKPYLRKDGSWAWVTISVGPLDLSQGQLIAAVKDITERKKTERERKRLLAELDATFASIAEGLLIYDLHGDIVRMNAAAKSILGVGDEFLGMPFEKRAKLLRLSRLDGGPVRREETPARRAINGETVRDLVLMVTTPAGAKRSLSFTSAPIHLKTGEMIGAVGTFADITTLHQLQEQQRGLIHLISHDLRTPLAAIGGHLQLIRGYLKAGKSLEQVERSAAAIERSSQRMTAMIQDLVDSARVEGGQARLELRSLELAPFLTDLLYRMSAALDTSRVRVEIPSGLWPVQADPNRLDRIFTNLLSNGLKYSDSQAPVLIRAENAEGQVVVSVQDFGRGIPPADQEHVFERFYRVQAERGTEGLGLGLYITRILVEAQGGRIWMKSAPGQGSTFSFTLPVAHAAKLAG